MNKCIYAVIFLLLGLQSSVASILAFDSFDGAGSGWNTVLDWEQLDSVVEMGDGVNLKATAVSGDLFRSLSSSIDLTGDGVYYLAAWFRASGTDQYWGIKMAQGVSDINGPQLVFNSDGGYRLLWRDLSGTGGWLSPDDIAAYEADTTYIGILKLVSSTSGDDTISVVMYDMTHGDVLPETEPMVYDATYVISGGFDRSNISHISLLANAAVESSFDNVYVADDWSDLFSGTAQASGDIRLIDSVTRNGSFELRDPHTAPITNAVGRRAIDAAGSFKIPDWTITRGAGYVGIDGSETADDGSYYAFVNKGASMTLESDSIDVGGLDLAEGDALEFSFRATDRDANGATFTVSFLVDGTEYTEPAVNFQPSTAGVYEQRTVRHFLQESVEGSVAVRILMENNTDTINNQPRIDSLELKVDRLSGFFLQPEPGPFFTEQNETRQEVTFDGGEVAALQSLLNNARSSYPDALLIAHVRGTVEVGTIPLVLGSKSCLSMEGPGQFVAKSGYSPSALLQILNAEYVSITASDGATALFDGMGRAATGILITSSGKVNLDNLDLKYFTGHGIDYTGRGDALLEDAGSVTRCTVSNCGGSGIKVTNSARFVLMDNTISNCTADGIDVFSQSATAVGNTCSGNRIGIVMGAPSDVDGPGGNVARNKLLNNQTGLKLASSAEIILVSENRLDGNATGMVIEGTQNHAFNNYMNNTVEFSITGSDNLILRNDDIASTEAAGGTGTKFFNPPTAGNPHNDPVIVPGMGRRDLTITQAAGDPDIDLVTVQTAVDAERSAYPGDVVVLWLNGNFVARGEYTGLSLPDNTCVVLSGTIYPEGTGMDRFSEEDHYAKDRHTGGTQLVLMDSPDYQSFSGGTLDCRGLSAYGIYAPYSSVTIIDGVTVKHAVDNNIGVLYHGGVTTPVFIRGCTLDGLDDAGEQFTNRGVWVHVCNYTYMLDNDGNGHVADTFDMDAAGHWSRLLFNRTANDKRTGFFIEEGATGTVVIGNEVTGDLGTGIALYNAIGGITPLSVMVGNRLSRALVIRHSEHAFAFNNSTPERFGVYINVTNNYSAQNQIGPDNFILNEISENPYFTASYFDYTTVNTGATSYAYDCGPHDSPVASGRTALTVGTTGDIAWSGGTVVGYDRNSGGDLHRDFILGTGVAQLEHKLASGLWRVTLAMGDSTVARDNMVVKAEGITRASDIDAAASSFAEVTFDLAVRDGALSLEFSDDGGSDPDWVVNGLTIVSLGPPSTEDDSDNDGLSDAEEFYTYGTDPFAPDSDLDGFSDGDEVAFNTSPLDAASYPAPSGLVAYYSFDEGSGSSAADHAINDGAQDALRVQGTVAWDRSDPRIGSSALSLDGSTSLRADDAIGAGATAFTISVWFKPAAEDPGYDGIFMARNENWGLAYVGSDAASDRMDYRIDNNPNAGSSALVSADGSITVGQWHHAAMTWSTDGSTATARAYLDGVLISSTDSTVHSSMAKIYTGYLSTWNIGDDPAASGREINSVIDDLAVFSEELTPQRVARIHSEGAAGNSFLSAFKPRDFGVSMDFGGASSLLLSWDSTGGAAFYDVLSDTNLMQSVSEWPVVGPLIPSGGDTTTFDASAYSSDPTRFFAIRETE